MPILVVGASGLLGSTLCTVFRNNDFSFIAASRNPEKLKASLGMPLQTIKADLENVVSYIPALQVCDTLVIAAHALLEKANEASDNIDRIGIIELINLAQKYKVKHVILFSIFGATLNHSLAFFRNKAAAEVHLEASGIPYTIIQCPAFMELHIQELIGKDVLNKKAVKLLGNGYSKTNFVSVHDLVNFTMCLLTSSPLNKTIVLSSPDHLSKRDVVNLYANLLGFKPKIISISNVVLNVLSVIIKPFHGGGSRLLKMAFYLDKIGTNIQIEKWPFQIKVTSVQDFVEQHVAKSNAGLGSAP